MNVPRPIDSGRESVENGRTRVVGSSAFKRRQQHPLENGRLTGSTRDGRLAVREAQLPAAAVPLETEHEESRRETTVPAFRMIVVAAAATLCTGATVLAADYQPSPPLDVTPLIGFHRLPNEGTVVLFNHDFLNVGISTTAKEPKVDGHLVLWHCRSSSIGASGSYRLDRRPRLGWAFWRSW